MNPQNIEEDTYVIPIDASSQKADLKDSYPDNVNMICRNNSDEPVFVKSSADATETLVFPTSSSVPLKGQIILPGGSETFKLNKNQIYIYAIQETAGTGDLYLTVGEGI